MSISVIFTGGTIGSSVREGYISTDSDAKRRLIEEFEKTRGAGDFDVSEPYSILSENLCSQNINALFAAIRAELAKNPEGIIITHGTDTLQYSAAFAGYVFAGCEVPVLFVSSAYPLEDSRANGGENFAAAVDFIRNRRGSGVFVSYANEPGEVYIHRATRLLAHSPYSDAVNSVLKGFYGVYISGRFMHNPDYIPRELNGDVFAGITSLSCANPHIMRIEPYVGFRYPEPDKNTEAVLHGTYHSGTFCANADAERFSEKCLEKGIPVFVTGAGGRENEYETVKAYSQFGFCVLPPASPVAMYCKLWLTLQTGLNAVNTMLTPVGGDLL